MLGTVRGWEHVRAQLACTDGSWEGSWFFMMMGSDDKKTKGVSLVVVMGWVASPDFSQICPLMCKYVCTVLKVPFKLM